MKLFFFLNKKLWWQGPMPRAVRRMRQMTVLGIALSIAALLVTGAVAGGFEKSFQKSLLAFHAHLSVLSPEELGLPSDELVRALEQIGLKPSEYQWRPYLYREGLLIHAGKLQGVVFKGIPTGKKGLTIGKALAKKWDLQTGETIKLFHARRPILLTVADTFEAGLYELETQFVLMDLDELQKLFGLGSSSVGFEVTLSDPARARSVTEALHEILPPYVSIQSWEETHQPLLEAFQLEKWFFRIVIGLMAAVSILNLIGAVLLHIYRKQKMIAILQALGLSPKKLRALFAGEAVGLGLAGLFLGLLSGGLLLMSLLQFHWMPLDPQVYFLDKLPIDFRIQDVLTIGILGALGVGGVAWLAAGRCQQVALRESLHRAV